MKNGGRIPRNVTVICEMFKTACQMGKHHMNGDLENHFKARSFRLAQWLNNIQFMRRTSQGSKNLERKFYLVCSSDIHCSQEVFWKGVFMVADIEEVEFLDALDIHA